MAIPKAYQTEIPIHQKIQENSVKLSTSNSSTAKTSPKKNSTNSYKFINLNKKTKYLWLGLIYTVIFCFIKCLLIVTKWESDEYKWSFFGVSLSIGKKSTASTPKQNSEKPTEKTEEKKPEKSSAMLDKNASVASNATTSPSGEAMSHSKESDEPKVITLPTDTVEFDALSTSSPKEVELLSKLSARRKDIEKREEKLKKRELALEIAMKQQNNKLEELTKLKEMIENLLKKTDKSSQEQSSNLVKIYEGMKPRNAAQIFDKLEPETLKQLILLMSQKKVSHILDQMNPLKAKELSLLLINDKNPFASRPKK